jgi:hypothetical protein
VAVVNLTCWTYASLRSAASMSDLSNPSATLTSALLKKTLLLHMAVT